jgi:hypothetical protein
MSRLVYVIGYTVLIIGNNRKKNAPRTMIKYQIWVSPDW